MATDFQFVGVDETLAAYESRAVDAWALFAGKRMIIRGVGIEELKKFLTMISNSGTVAVYTLKVYENAGDASEVKANTPDDGSFNFKLFSLDGTRGQLSGIIGRHYGDPLQEEIMNRLGAIEERLEPQEDDGILQQITNAAIGMLQEPRKLSEFISAIGAIGKPQATPPPYHFPTPYNTVSGVSRVGQTPQQTRPAAQPAADLTTPESLQRIGDAIETLGKHDPKIVDHLEKLAKIATENSSQFKTLLILLDTQ